MKRKTKGRRNSKVCHRFVLFVRSFGFSSLEIKKEIESVKREYHKNKLKKVVPQTEEEKKEVVRNETLEEYKSDYFKYKDKKKSLPKKGAEREEFTLNLLNKFKNKLNAIKEQPSESAGESKVPDDDAWLVLKLF